MNNKRVMVYGANGGIGSAICKELHLNAYEIVFSGRSRDKLIKTKNDLGIPGIIENMLLTISLIFTPAWSAS